MIYIVTQRNSKNLGSFNKHFPVKKFNDFDELEIFTNDNVLNSKKPLAIISDEISNGINIYDVLKKDKLRNYLNKIPLLVIKEKLKGNEIFKEHHEIIDDYIPINIKTNDLIERIRFLLMYHNEGSVIKQKTYFLKKYLLFFDMAIRRTVDWSASFMLLILLMPIFFLVSILIKIESKGPVIYLSYRAGTGYHIFKIWKFRTMHANADGMLENFKNQNQYSNEDGTSNYFKISNDPRVTKVGAFLRKTSIDELPQLFNVLRGEMSLIGNRPLPLYEAKTLTYDHISKRFAAPAGISGLWQVKKRGNEEMSAEERMNLDVKYAEKFNILMDIKIFFQTFPALLQKNPS